MVQDRNLPESFFARDTTIVAKDLLGQALLRKTDKGEMLVRIVEVEAYLDESDPASHASSGRDSRARIFWGPPGRAYVFVIYGIHYCLNAIAQPEGHPGCVLIRAAEPLEGLEVMRSYRPDQDDRNLTNGPAKLCQALNIDPSQNGVNLTSRDSELQIVEGLSYNFEVKTTPRIGISKAKEEMLRFAILDNPYVSRR